MGRGALWGSMGELDTQEACGKHLGSNGPGTLCFPKLSITIYHKLQKFPGDQHENIHTQCVSGKLLIPPS